MNAMIAVARPSYGRGYRPSYAELAGGQRLKLSGAELPTIPQPIALAADATALPSVYRSLRSVRTINSFETITLFSRVTLITKLQSTSDLDHFQARELPCSRVKSRDNPISGRRGDSGVLFSFITARHNARIASDVLAMAFPSVCPSVALHADIVSKRRHVA